jgi:hypothetical protein
MSATYTVNDPIPSTRFSIPDSYSLSLSLSLISEWKTIT